MGCGFCAATFQSKDGPVRIVMRRSEPSGEYQPHVEGWRPGSDPGTFICPGAGMDMPVLAQAVYGREPPDAWLGEVISTAAAHSNDPGERALAASGGTVPALLRLLFDEGRIAQAYVLGTDPGKRDGTGRIIRSIAEFATAHGSHYHPADFGAALPSLLESNEPFAFIGLPCQIAALQMAMQTRPQLKQRAVVLISLFCGGINSFQGISYYMERHGIAGEQVSAISYRNGAWPGHIEVTLKDGTQRRIERIRGNSRLMVMHYMAAFQGFFMLKRCRICPDQVGDFADISVGDPHSERFRTMSAAGGGGGFSAVVTRTARGQSLMERAVAGGYLTISDLSRDEVVASQGYTLVQRRHADTYAKIERDLGGTPPVVRTYSAFAGKAPPSVRRIARIDLKKLRYGAEPLQASLVWFWQTFEYAFLRFPVSGLTQRLKKILTNR